MVKPMRLADGVDAKERNRPAAEMPGCWPGRPGECQRPFMRVEGQARRLSVTQNGVGHPSTFQNIKFKMPV